jgi:signal transduction histidine kinase
MDRGKTRAFWIYLSGALIALAALSVLIASGTTVTWPEDGMSLQLSSGRVLSVLPGGPAEQAGLMPGDMVIRADGRDLADSRFYRGRQAGDTVWLTVLQGGEVSDVPLTLISPSTVDRFWRLIPGLVAASFWGAGVAMLVLRPRDETCRAFFHLAYVVALTLAAGQLSTFNVSWGNHLFVGTLAVLPPLLVHAYSRLVAPDLPRIRMLLPWLSGTSALFLLPDLALLVLFGRHAHTVPVWLVWRRTLLLYLGASTLCVIIGMVYAYATTRQGPVRRRLRVVACAVVVGFLPLVLLSLLPEILWGTSSGVPFQFTFPFLLFLPFAHVYVITRYDLRLLDRVINRSLVVFTLGLVWGGVYLALTAIGLRLLRDAPLLYPVVGLVTTVIMALLLTPLRARIQQSVDRLFYGGWYDYRRVIVEVSRALSGVVSREALGEHLVLPVVNGLRLRGAALYLHCGDTGEFRRIAQHGLDLPDEAVDLQPVEDGAEADVVPAPAGWQQRGVAWVLALRRREAEPVGWLLLGGKREDDFFEGADGGILQTLQEQATLAAENVLLFEDLQQTARALEAAQQRLLSAREEERRLLAWELHDGPLQDLIALSYTLYNSRRAARDCAPEIGQRLDAARLEALRIKNVLREVCRDLRSDLLDLLGLGAALRHHVHDLIRSHEVIIYLDLPPGHIELPDAVEIALFRICQEALANAVAHARVREVWVCLGLDEDTYDLGIWDHGQGFTVPPRLEALALQGHFGLMTMRERATAVGAQFEVCARPGHGTQIRVWGSVHQAHEGSASPNTLERSRI